MSNATDASRSSRNRLTSVFTDVQFWVPSPFSSPDSSFWSGSANNVRSTYRRLDALLSLALSATSRHLLRPDRRSLAGCCGSTHQTRHARPLADGHLPRHGGRRFPRTMESPRSHPRCQLHPRRRSPRPAPNPLGHSRRLPLGRCQYAYCLRHPRHRPQHRVSSLEFQFAPRHSLGFSVLQRTSRRGPKPLARRSRWHARHVRRRSHPRYRFLGHAHSRNQSHARRSRRTRGRRPLGHDVHPVPQGLSLRYEPAQFRHVLHHR